jgi:hypothetical protein
MKGDIAYCANPKCGKQFIKKRITQNCCGNASCRALYNRHKKGLPIYPDFLNYDPNSVSRSTGYSPSSGNVSNLAGSIASSAAGAALGHAAKSIGRGSLAGAVAGNVVSAALIPYLKKILNSGMKFSFNTINSEVDVWEARLAYYKQRKEEALNGVSSVKTLGIGAAGAAAGAAFAGEGQKAQRAFLFGAIGAALGAYLDAQAMHQHEVNKQFILEESEAGIIECENQIAILKGERLAYKSLVDEEVLVEDSDGVYVVSKEVLNSTISGVDYKKMDIEYVKFKGAYHYLLGSPGKNFYKIVTGNPGNGKSTYAITFADYYSRNHGKVLYCPAEQAGANKDLQNLLNRTNVKGGFDIQQKANVLSADDLISLVSTQKYDLIVLDSINKMKISPDDITRIRTACPDLAIFAIMQSTKDGSFKGGQEYFHDCDVFLKIEDFVAYQTKARSAGKSYMPIDQLVDI